MDPVKLITDRIAQKHLGIATLDTRRSDELDFHNLPVWMIREALKQAFTAGLEIGVGIAK